MGLLDDAIREHLELKRRRGGDPADIERAEREALGPVRREPEPIAPADFDEPEGVEHELGGEYDEDPAGYDLPYHDAEPDGLEDDLYARPPGALAPEPPLPHGVAGVGPQAPAGGPENFGFDPEEDPWVASAPSGPARGAKPYEHAGPDVADAPHQDPLPEPSEPAGGPAPVSPPSGALPDHLNQETVEYRLEPEPHAAAPHSGEPEAEDVLEETPEFLQDAPEHDRLWFEQRPPRDFDFDS